MKYTLEPYKGNKTRYICPNCNSKQSFTRYIDIETNNYIDDKVGRCNKEINCGYHKTPKNYFDENNINIECKPFFKSEEQINLKPDYIDYSILFSSLKNYQSNNLITYLSTIFDTNTIIQLVKKYYIGTSNHWQGSTIFWQIDEVNKIRTGKIMLYNKHTGKRIKEPYNKLYWQHKKINNVDFKLKQTLFGMHLIKGSDKPIAIVESEKTAIICSVYYPKYIWLATGGLNNLKVELLRILAGKNVVLFPDLGCYNKWFHKAKEFKQFCNIKVSNILELNATEDEKNKGLDLADYVLINKKLINKK